MKLSEQLVKPGRWKDATQIDLMISVTRISMDLEIYKILRFDYVAYALVDDDIFICSMERGFKVDLHNGKRAVMRYSGCKPKLGGYKYNGIYEEDGITYHKFSFINS